MTIVLGPTSSSTQVLLSLAPSLELTFFFFRNFVFEVVIEVEVGQESASSFSSPDERRRLECLLVALKVAMASPRSLFHCLLSWAAAAGVFLNVRGMKVTLSELLENSEEKFWQGGCRPAGGHPHTEDRSGETEGCHSSVDG